MSSFGFYTGGALELLHKYCPEAIGPLCKRLPKWINIPCAILPPTFATHIVRSSIPQNDRRYTACMSSEHKNPGSTSEHEKKNEGGREFGHTHEPSQTQQASRNQGLADNQNRQGGTGSHQSGSSSGSHMGSSSQGGSGSHTGSSSQQSSSGSHQGSSSQQSSQQGRPLGSTSQQQKKDHQSDKKSA